MSEQVLSKIDRVDESVNTLAALQAGYNDERDLANQIFGQIQMGMAISKFTDVVSLQKLKHIKETKMYRALSGQKGVDRDGAEIPDVGTFDGFCRALGTSASKVDEDLKNLAVFGEDALAQLTKAGAGYREQRQYRRLPEDQKAALTEAAKAGDKDSFLELAEDLIAKHAKEKQALAQKNSELEKDAQATGRVLADKQSEITKLQTQVATKKYLPHVDWPEAMKGYIEQAQKAGNEVCNALDALKTIRENAMKVTPESADERACLGNAWMALAEEMSAILDKVSVKLESEKGSFENTLNAVAEEHREENQ